MANDEHVAILKQGVDSWNAWRGENPEITPYLGAANLSLADLSRANLHGANLSEAKHPQSLFSSSRHILRCSRPTFGNFPLASQHRR
jgi:pentapeptide repeat protein